MTDKPPARSKSVTRAAGTQQLDHQRTHDPGFDEEIARHAKQAMRQQLRAVRSRLPTDAIKQRSAAIVQRLVALEPIRNASVIAMFSPIRNEPQLNALHNLLGPNTRFAYPLVRGEHELAFHCVATTDELTPGAFGILEPRGNSAQVAANELDVVLVPGLAFDTQGHRIGYGAGHYDRVLKQATHAFVCGVAYDFQFFDELPREPHDQPVTAVATDQRVHHVTHAIG